MPRGLLSGLRRIVVVHERPGGARQRRLPDSWWWISANLFEDLDVAVEALLARTRVWNSARLAMNAGYLWIEDQDRRHLLIHPLNGLIRIEGTPENFTLEARRLGRPRPALQRVTEYL